MLSADHSLCQFDLFQVRREQDGISGDHHGRTMVAAMVMMLKLMKSYLKAVLRADVHVLI